MNLNKRLLHYRSFYYRGSISGCLRSVLESRILTDASLSSIMRTKRWHNFFMMTLEAMKIRWVALRCNTVCIMIDNSARSQLVVTSFNKLNCWIEFNKSTCECQVKTDTFCCCSNGIRANDSKMTHSHKLLISGWLVTWVATCKCLKLFICANTKCCCQS